MKTLEMRENGERIRGRTCKITYISAASKAVFLLWIINIVSVLFLLCFCARLFIDALWPPARKGLTSWLSFVMSNC